MKNQIIAILLLCTSMTSSQELFSLDNSPTNEIVSNVNLTQVAENYRVNQQTSLLSSTLQVMHQLWKKDSIEVNETDLLMMEQSSLQDAIKNDDLQLVAIYIQYGWEIRPSDLLLASDNESMLKLLLTGNLFDIEKAHQELIDLIKGIKG